MYTKRLFVAITLPKRIHRELSSLHREIMGARWIPEESLHVTLIFIGEVSQEIFKEIKDDLEDITMTQMDLHLKGVDLFGPGDNPKILYSSVTGSDYLLELHQLIKKKVKQYVQVEKRDFKPHVTLARLKHSEPDLLAELLTDFHNFKSPAFTAKDFHLMSSELRPEGARYHIEQSYELY
jgi:2'-5' RNA ligase